MEEASRIVSDGANGPVDATTRLVQEEIYAALTGKDGLARQRVLDRLQEISEREARKRRETIEWVLEAKFRLDKEFRQAQKLRQTAPNILPHPQHVEVTNETVRFIGPITDDGRAAWELTKARIRIAACMQKMAKAEFERTGCAIVKGELETLKKYRRALMRLVPKGWNWREEIYSRDSMLDFAKDTVRKLEEIGYVAPEIDDRVYSA